MREITDRVIRSGASFTVDSGKAADMAHEHDDNPRRTSASRATAATRTAISPFPPPAAVPGVIVIQEWWGLTDHIAAIADRLAAEGFVALAPDLYGGKTTHDADEAG